MSNRTITLPRLLVGLAVGAAAFAYYSGMRASRQQLSGVPGEMSARLDGPPAPAPSPVVDAVFDTIDSASSANGVTIMQDANDTTPHAHTSLQHRNSAATAVQQRVGGLLETVGRSIASARAQLDAAIAEGQVTAAQTRVQLEERFVEAKHDPQRARTAFQ